MQIAYSTYALQGVDPFEAVARVKEIGYDALEINCGSAWPTAPERFGAGPRSRLRDALHGAGFPPPAVMHLIGLCAAAEEVAAQSEQLRQTCRLARDLSWQDRPSVVTTTLGPQAGSWDESKEAVALRLRRYGEMVAEENCILAVEPHIGQELDTPEKADWLVQAVGHPHVRLNLRLQPLPGAGNRTGAFPRTHRPLRGTCPHQGWPHGRRQGAVRPARR